MAVCLFVLPAFYMFLAMRSSLNLGLRHVLLVYPFPFTGLGVAAARAWSRTRRVSRAAGAGLLLILVLENLTAYPGYIPFFNAAAGGPRGGLKLLSDSNLDWGQDLPALADWQRTHPEFPLLLDYFGSADPRHFGLRYVNLLGSGAPFDLASAPPGPAMVAISATNLQKTYVREYPPEIVPALSGNPAAVVGGSIYLFPIHLNTTLQGR